MVITMSRPLLAGVLAALALTGACVPVVPILGAGAAVRGVSQERTTRAGLSDIETEVTINNHLLSHSGEFFRRVNVEVVEGRALLTGAVSRADHRIEAEKLAWRAPGTREVVNELVIDGDAGFGRYAQDVWITTQLRSRLIADTSVASVNYNIETHRGVVHLIGLSRSDAELQRVTEIAARVPGVTQVVSHVMAIDDPRRRA
jgi:osmotically-inducible protein OsmY